MIYERKLDGSWRKKVEYDNYDMYLNNEFKISAQIWSMYMNLIKAFGLDVIWTHSTLMWSQMRYYCTTKSAVTGWNGRTICNVRAVAHSAVINDFKVMPYMFNWVKI